MSKNRKFEIRIQVSLITFLTLAIALISLIIYLPWQRFSRDSISRLVEDLNREIMARVMGQVAEIYDKAVNTEYVIKNTFASGVVDLYDKEQRGQFYLQLLKANSNFTWISFGFPDGDFFGAQRKTPGEINLIDNNWLSDEEKALREIRYYLKKGDNFVYETTHILSEYDYRSTARSWYKLALTAIDEVWTEIYRFSTSQKPGFNTALSLDINGEFKGVISIALELEDLSLYLKGLKIGKSGRLYIIDDKERVLASQVPEEIRFSDQLEDGREVLRRLADFEGYFPGVISSALNKHNRKVSEIWQFESWVIRSGGEGYVVSFQPIPHMGWVIVTVLPESDYLGEIEHNSILLLLLVLLLLVTSSFFLLLVSRRLLVKPLLGITDQLVHVESFDLDKVAETESHIKEVNMLSRGLHQMTRGLLSFQKYIPTELVREMISEGIQAEIGGQERELTIFFSDIASFTKIFETHGNALIYQLGEYMNEISGILTGEKGSIDKYIGDSIMAFWGAPVPNRNHAEYACRGAVRARERLARLKIKWEKDGRPVFHSRVGINTGLVVVGNIGSHRRLNYTVMGDPVNLASRLESLNKIYRTDILIGSSTFQQAKEYIVARKIDRVAVYGKSRSEDIYELICMREDVNVTDNFGWIEYYEKAFALYQSRQWDAAYILFKKVKNLKGREDYPSRLMMKYCRLSKLNPPPENWDGTRVMKSK